MRGRGYGRATAFHPCRGSPHSRGPAFGNVTRTRSASTEEQRACDVTGPVPYEQLMRGKVIPLALTVLVLPGCGAERQSSSGGEGSPTVVATVDPAVATK